MDADTAIRVLDAILPALALIVFLAFFIFWIDRKDKHSPDFYFTENPPEVIPGETRDPLVGKTATSREGL